MYQQKNRLIINLNGNEMFELASNFEQDVEYYICLSANGKKKMTLKILKINLKKI